MGRRTLRTVEAHGMHVVSRDAHRIDETLCWRILAYLHVCYCQWWTIFFDSISFSYIHTTCSFERKQTITTTVTMSVTICVHFLCVIFSGRRKHLTSSISASDSPFSSRKRRLFGSKASNSLCGNCKDNKNTIWTRIIQDMFHILFYITYYYYLLKKNPTKHINMNQIFEVVWPHRWHRTHHRQRYGTRQKPNVADQLM